MTRTKFIRTAALLCPLAAGPVALPLAGQIFGLSESQEIEVGRQAAKKVDADMPILKDASVTRFVDHLGQKLVRRSQRRNIQYTFKVVNSPEINAFALPGGFIYVNRGLLEAADNESEVAGVLGHEIGHVVGRHSAEQMKKQGIAELGLGVLGAVLGNNASTAAEITKLGSKIGATAAFTKFSRDDEREADLLGVHNLYDAGYKPDGMVTFFEKLSRLRKQQPSKLETFFATHPSPSERVANVSREIRNLRPSSNQVTTTWDFNRMKRRLAQLPEPPKPKGR